MDNFATGSFSAMDSSHLRSRAMLSRLCDLRLPLVQRQSAYTARHPSGIRDAFALSQVSNDCSAGPNA